MPNRAYIGIGTNLGDRAANYREAIQRIASLPDTRVVRRSSIYESEPVGDIIGNIKGGFFLNGVIEIETEFMADALMRRLLAIERQLGRRRPAGRRPASRTRYRPRIIDSDLLADLKAPQRVSLARADILRPPQPRKREVATR